MRIQASVLAALSIGLACARVTPAAAFAWPDAAVRIERDLTSPDPGVRRAAADKLRTLGPGVATPLLLHALEDTDTEVRVVAARAAIAKHLTRAAHAVLPWLSERDARLRIAACEVLGQLPDPAGVTQLARALGDADASVRTAAAAALGGQDPKEATPALLGKLDDSSPAVRVEVVVALARLHDVRAVVPLVGKAQDSVPEVRQAVARTLGDLGDARAAPALVLSLRDGSADVRTAAVAALGQLRAEKAADAIAPLASDKNPLIRRVAVDALGQIASTESIRALVGLLGSGDDASAGLEPTPPREALVAAGPAAVPALRSALASPASPGVAASAAWALGQLHARGSLADIVKAMRAGTLPTAPALHAVADIGGSDAVPVVLEFVDDSNPQVRREALAAAERVLDPAHPDGRAVEPLAAALHDPTLPAADKAKAVALLGRTGAPRAATSMVALLGAKDPVLRLAAIDALGALGPTGNDGPLLAQLDDPDPAVRLHAAVALGRAGGSAARDALVEKLDKDADADRAATLAALRGVMARLSTDPAVAVLSRALRLAPGPERDALILVIGEAETPSAEAVVRDTAASPNPDDRRTLATVLPARTASRALAVESLRALAMDPDPSVRAEAAWSLGDIGGPAEVPLLQHLVSVLDPAPAVDSTAALARIAARGGGADAATLLCPLLVDARAYVRANAAAGLALSGARCGDGAAERRILAEDATPVRAGAARAIRRHPLGPIDAHALARCRTSDASGAVALLCRMTKTEPEVTAAERRAPAAQPESEAVELYVEGEIGATPEPRAPYVIELADGLVRSGRCDRRGAVYDPVAPKGEVALLRTIVTR